MSTAAQSRFADVLTEEANRVRKNRGWFLALGREFEKRLAAQ
jgi:hypothetical protein